MFPLIKHINDVHQHIMDCPEIKVINKGDYIVINYVVVTNDTFNAEKLSAKAYAMRKECRGIMFDPKTGNVIRRPFHKFFNLNEKPETAFDAVVPYIGPGKHIILDKLDGSMIAPFIAGGKLIFGTKMGETEAAVNANRYALGKLNYRTLAGDLIERGYTPIFEWCSPNQRIVIDYPRDMLVLTAIRDMESGLYMLYDGIVDIGNMYQVPVVENMLSSMRPLDEIASLVKYDVEGNEGVVIILSDGNMVKIKADVYLNIHRAKDNMKMERNVLKIVLENQEDDLLANLPKEDAEKLSAYSEKVKSNMELLSVKLFEIYNMAPQTSKKDFALFVLEYHRRFSQMLFKIYDGNDPLETVLNFFLTHTGSSVKLEEIRDLIGVKWNETIDEE